MNNSIVTFRTIPINNLYDEFFADMQAFTREFLRDDFDDDRWDSAVKQIAMPSYPVADVFVTNDGTTIFEVAVTGFAKEDIDINIEDNKLIIEAKSDRHDINEKDYKYISKRIARRNFKSSYKLSSKMDIDKIDVSIADGILTINIPMREEAKPIKKQLQIK